MSRKLTTTLSRAGRVAAVCAAAMLLCPAVAAGAENAREARLHTPVQEWAVSDVRFSGNPFDVEAHAVFTHQNSGVTHTTGLFHDGGSTWRFRFSPTRAGEWDYTTASDNAGLDGHSGRIVVRPDDRARGCLTVADANKWAWRFGENGARAFTPQLVMYKFLDVIAGMTDDEIRRDIDVWFTDHGFNGLHVGVMCRWFDFGKQRHSEFDTDDPNPDPRTFEVLERLIRLTHEAGGFVHIWKWGDEDRRMTPIRWGINGEADRRLQRYLAARLGPLPGWTLGYGFDLWEWVTEPQLLEWHAHMKQQLGWSKFIGGRTHAWHKPVTEAITYELDYVGYESHRPDYDLYVKAMGLKPDRPTFMEDRFRVRDNRTHRAKDYSLDDTRRGLWRSAMAGGIANIWGYLLPDDDQGGSRPFPNRAQVRAYADFFENRPLNGFERDNDISDAHCLRRGATHFLFYAEDADSVAMDLSKMDGPRPAVAVDTKVEYVEFDLGNRNPEAQKWNAPYASDWAIAVGNFKAIE